MNQIVGMTLIMVESEILLGSVLFLFLLGWLGTIGYVLYLILRNHLRKS